MQQACSLRLYFWNNTHPLCLQWIPMSSEIPSVPLSSSPFQNTQLAKIIFPKLVSHWYRKYDVKHENIFLHTLQIQFVGWLTHKHKHTQTPANTDTHTQSNLFSSVLAICMKMIGLMKMSGCNYLQIKNITKSDYMLCSRYACLSRCF